MEKYPVRNVIFEGKCYKTSAILDAELSCTDCIEDLVVDKFFSDNPYYGEFLGVMKNKQYEYDTMYNRMCCSVEYSYDDDASYFFKTHIFYKRMGIIGLIKYLKLRGLDSITNYNGKRNNKLLSMLQERR